MKRLWLAYALFLAASPAQTADITAAAENTTMIFDFSLDSSAWPSINDVVMGGRSSSAMRTSSGIATFEGTVSLDNNGGFASVRSRPRELDLSAFDGLTLRLRGDGKRYKLRLTTSASFNSVAYQAALEPPAGKWTEVVVPFSAFEPRFRGRAVPQHPALDPAAVQTMGLLISDRQQGPFRLELAWIRGWSSATAEASDGDGR